MSVVQAFDFYTRDELAQFFPTKKFLKLFNKRHTFEASNAGCIYGDILVDLPEYIIPEKLLASMLLYVRDREALSEDCNLPLVINAYEIGYIYKEAKDCDPLAVIITLLRKSHRKMSCLCHLWLATLLGGKQFECLNHGEAGKIPGNHKLYSRYGVDKKTLVNDLVNWVVTNSKAVIPFVEADNSNIDRFVGEALINMKRVEKVLKFFMDFCKFDDAEINYLLTVIDQNIDMVNIPTINPEIFPAYLQEKYKAALMGTTNAKGECSTCYLKEFTRVNCVLHTELRIHEEPLATTKQLPYQLEADKKPEEDPTKECTICCDKKPTHVAVPCGHAYCGVCINKIYKSNKCCAFCKRTMTFPMEILWN